MTLTANRKTERQLREAVAEISGYYHSTSEAMNKAVHLLRSFGLDVGEELEASDDGDGSQRYMLELLCDVTGEEVGNSALIWCQYRMPLGTWEITCYLS